MTTATIITPDMMLEALSQNDELMALLEEQILEKRRSYVKAHTTTAKPRVAKPVGKKSRVEKLESPLETHDEAEHVKARKDGKKAEKGKKTKTDIKPGVQSTGFDSKATCKRYGLLANGTEKERLERIEKYESGDACKDDFVNSPAKTARQAIISRLNTGVKKTGNVWTLYQRWQRQFKGELQLNADDLTKSAPRGAIVGVTYREAQKAITAFRKSIGNKAWKELVDGTDLKNIGWDNILELALLIDDAYGIGDDHATINKLVDLATR